MCKYIDGTEPNRSTKNKEVTVYQNFYFFFGPKNLLLKKIYKTEHVKQKINHKAGSIKIKLTLQQNKKTVYKY